MTAGRVGIAERDLQGLGRFRSLRKLLARLPKAGTRRDPAGNRQLPMDQYWGLVLLWLFNPAIRTLRGLQRATEFEKLREGLPVLQEPALAASAPGWRSAAGPESAEGRMPKRGQHGVSEGLEGRSERPARWHGQHRARARVGNPVYTRGFPVAREPAR